MIAAKIIDANLRKQSEEPSSNSNTSYGSSGDHSIHPVLTESPKSDADDKHIDNLISELRRSLMSRSKMGKQNESHHDHPLSTETICKCMDDQFKKAGHKENS